MIPLVTPEEMKAVDDAAPHPTEVLVARAGAAVARAALHRLGGGYGRRVVVVAGKGNNGADGRVAAERLRRAGVRVELVEAAGAPAVLPRCDLVIDAAYGTGFRGEYEAPDAGDSPVLAVDIPSGVDGLSGEAGPGAVTAHLTVTFAALKPGLVLGAGPERSGRVEVADIGLDVGRASMAVVEDSDVTARLPRRRREGHKWNAAVFVAAGSAGMTGAAQLVGRGAFRSGASTVRLGVPGALLEDLPATEAVGIALPNERWADTVLDAAGRCKAIVVGPGLGRSDLVLAEVRRLVKASPLPLVVDADALGVFGDASEVPSARAPLVLTPHEGEFGRLSGSKPGPDRIADVRALARRTGATVLLKGPATVVASPEGDVLVATSGSPRLATAGSGDVLAGVVASFLAQGMAPLEAAALGAHAHGASASFGFPHGLVAGDLPELVAEWLSNAVSGVHGVPNRYAMYSRAGRGGRRG